MVGPTVNGACNARFADAEAVLGLGVNVQLGGDIGFVVFEVELGNTLQAGGVVLVANGNEQGWRVGQRFGAVGLPEKIGEASGAYSASAAVIAA